MQSLACFSLSGVYAVVIVYHGETQSGFTAHNYSQKVSKHATRRNGGFGRRVTGSPIDEPGGIRRL